MDDRSILAESPAHAEVTFEADEDARTLTVDEHLDVIETVTVHGGP